MSSKRSYEDEQWEDAGHPKRPRAVDFAPDDDSGIRYDARSSLTHNDYTIAWICALYLELATSRAMLDEEHQLLAIQPGDDNVYVPGRIGQHNVVMVCLPGQYGTNNAAVVATNLKRTFPRIRATFMVGIGGGCPSQADLYLGDVVVGTRVMQYDMGKVTVGGCFQETAVPKTPAPLLNAAVSTLRSLHSQHNSSSRMASLLQSRLSDLRRPIQPDRLFQAFYEHPPGAPTCDGCDLENLQRRGLRLSDEPKIHYGVIASGNRVMKDGKTRDNIAKRLSALCFEMEAAGMMDNLQCLPIRGICDYADSHKSKEWQSYAAATAAAYARELVEALPHSPRQLGPATIYSSTAGESDTTSYASNYASERRERLLASLTFSQIDTRKTNIGTAHATTCRWLLQHADYRDWLDPEMQSQNHGFLWIRGKAGAGKSTMMKFLFLETKKKANTPTASFFFNARGDYLEKSITGMYRSILLQLLKLFPDRQSVLDDTDIIPWSQQDCPNLNVLKELLRGAVMALGQRSFTCFIDALDECDEQEVRDMVQYFEDLTKNTTDNSIPFRVCFSSRPYPYIDIRQGALLTLEDQKGHTEDLTKYVKNRLNVRNPTLLAELQTKILDKAGGIFMWIVLVVEILNKETNRGALALRKKISEIPSELSNLFRSILKRDEERQEWLLLCVLWVLCAKRPLGPEEFRHALWAGLLETDEVDRELPNDTDDDAVSLVTSSSKGLVEVTKSKEPKVQFIHQSVPDFLVKEKGLQDLWPDLGFDWEGRSHERLRLCCAAYLSHSEVQKFVGGTKDEDKPVAMAEKYSFLQYASQQILHHANIAALAAPQDDFLSHFFASGGVGVMNLFERRKTRAYSVNATPLYVLADQGLENLVHIQMKKESPICAPKETYRYPLFAALANGHTGTVAALLGLSSIICNGASIMEGLKYRKDFTEFKGRTPLSWAAQDGRLSIVQALVQGGADTDEADRKGSRPLLRALQNGHEAVARLLMEKGADINTTDKDGWTALMWASQNGHEAVARLLIEKGADINAQNNVGRTALMLALQNGHEAVARLLIEKGADITTTDKYGWTALMLASQNGHEAVARLLIEKGADINAQNNNGHEAVARLLIEKGADINTTDKYGWTALMWASQNGREAVARLLIEKGADITTTDKYGWTALMWASQNGREAVARLLIEKGADITTTDKYGWTALMWASQNGREAVARLLIEKGADINIQEPASVRRLHISALQLVNLDFVFGDASTREKLGPSPTVAQVNAVLNAAKTCANEKYCEASWNLCTHRDVLQLAVPMLTAAEDGVFFMPCPTAKIIDKYIDGRGPSRKVDFCFVIEPGPQAADAIRAIQHSDDLFSRSINHTDYQPVRCRPIGLSIESKVEGQRLDDAHGQLLIWLEAQWRQLRRLASRVDPPHPLPDFLPAILVDGHKWSFLACTSDGNQTTLWTDLPLGTTQQPLGVYTIFCCLQSIAHWIKGDYWTAFQRLLSPTPTPAETPNPTA
ncbi:putative ankyrin repeat protein [Colletotrichum fructicola]|nr:putative ankyrin repeat protein [Colletotrichum fructicola]